MLYVKWTRICCSIGCLHFSAPEYTITSEIVYNFLDELVLRGGVACRLYDSNTIAPFCAEHVNLNAGCLHFYLALKAPGLLGNWNEMNCEKVENESKWSGLFGSPIFSDVTIIVDDGTEIPV